MTRIIGIDIGHYSIKLAEVDTTGRSWDIIGLYDLPRADGVEVGAILKEFFETSGVKAERIAVGLPDTPVFIRSMEFPFSDRRRVQAAVNSELEDVLPFELSDQIVDIQPLGRGRDRRHKFLVGLSPVLPISALNKTFETAGIIPTGFFLPAESLGQLSLYQDLSTEKDKDQYRVMIDIGFETTQLSIVKGYRGDGSKAKAGSPDDTGVVDFRQFSHGIRNVIEWIQQARNVDFEEARKWLLHRAQIKSGNPDKVNTAPQMSDELSDDIKVAFRPIVVEIYQFIQNFRAKAEKVVTVGYITGGLSHLSGLKEFLTEELRLPLNHWATFTGFNTEKATLSSDQERTFTLALSLASRYAIRHPSGWLNFRRSDQARRKILTSFYEKLSLPEKRKPLVLGFGLLALFVGYSGIGNYLVGNDISKISNEVSLDFRRLNRDLGKKAEKFPQNVAKLRALFEKEKLTNFGTSDVTAIDGGENLSPRKKIESLGPVLDKARSEFILELSQIKSPQNFILNSLSLNGPTDMKLVEIKINAKWKKNSTAETASSQDSALLVNLEKEIESTLAGKGYQNIKVEGNSDSVIQMTASWYPLKTEKGSSTTVNEKDAKGDKK